MHVAPKRYRTVAKWEIATSEVRESRGLRELLGIGQYSQEISIRFRGKETTITVRTSDLMTLDEINRMIPELARRRYQHHHKYGTGNEYNLEKSEDGLADELKKLGVTLPDWLK